MATLDHSLASVFLAAAQATPEARALWVGGSAYSYADLHRESQRIANVILSADITGDAGDAPQLIGVFAYKSAAAYQGILGALLAGKGYVPFNPRFPAERTQAMAALSGIRTLVVDRRCEAVAQTVLAHIENTMLVILPEHDAPPEWAVELARHHFICGGEINGFAPATPNTVVNDDACAYVMFTSGSTGVPKGVMVNHGNVLSYVENVRTMFAPGGDDRFSQVFDLTFDLSVHDMFVCWASGAALYVVPEEALIGPAKFIQEHGLTFWFSVPSTAGFMKKFGMLQAGAFPSLRMSLFCGEPLPDSLAAAWQTAAAGSSVYNLYGPTEATIAITGHAWRADDARRQDGLVPIGEPFVGHAAAIVNSDLQDVAVGEAGELCVHGAQVTPGYLDNAELTDRAFVALPGHQGADNRWYRTGDRVRRREDGVIEFLGRVDDQVKIRGYRVELAEVETVIRDAAGSDLVAVVPGARTAEQGIMNVVAFVSGSATAENQIIDACKRVLPDYMVPARVHGVEHFPLNANGKIDRRELEKMHGEGRV